MSSVYAQITMLFPNEELLEENKAFFALFENRDRELDVDDDEVEDSSALDDALEAKDFFDYHDEPWFHESLESKGHVLYVSIMAGYEFDPEEASEFWASFPCTALHIKMSESDENQRYYFGMIEGKEAEENEVKKMLGNLTP